VVWDNSPDAVRCPSDPNNAPGGRLNSYAFSVGDQAEGTRDGQINRGMFAFQRNVRFRDVTDGLSNTALMSERLIHIGYAGGAPTSAALNEVEFVTGTAERPGVHDNPIACRGLVVGRFYAPGTPVNNQWGRHWVDGQDHRVSFNTILPPNSPSCYNAGSNADQTGMVLPPVSRHSR
jgi:hypothetical protein